ncbi:MAG: PAS domain S-box protein, partial [Desulfobacterota bacterium]|nr:PAS domain S-box protein [Thermodesulfobacteriota bacterium]
DYSLGVTFTALDITDRKRSEAARQALALKWQTTFDAMNDAIALLDEQSRVVQCNRTMSRLLQKSAPEIIGRACYDLMLGAGAPIRNCPSERALQTRQREALSWEIGSRCYEVVADPIFDPQGQITGVVLILTDMTENKKAAQALQRSERLYRLIAENVTDVVWALDLETRRFRYVSPSVKRLRGYTPEEVMAQPVEAALTPGSLSYLNTLLAERLPRIGENEKSPLVFFDEMEQTCRDGSTVWTEVTSRLLINVETGHQEILGVSRDISARKKAEEQQKALEQQLRQAQKLEAIGTLAGGIAHDFNNILGAVIGFTELARMEIPEASQARQDLDQVLQAGQRAKELVRQILTFSRKGVETLAALDMVPIIKEALKLLRASLPATIEIKTRLTVSEAVVKSDPTQIHQILMNLCTNAAQAMGEEGGTLEVSLAEAVFTPAEPGPQGPAGPGPYLELTVKDTGPGLSPEILEHIFEPYFTTKEKGLGTGLGLSVVHGIVQRHGGLIRVQSQPGAGSCFRVFLPRLEDVAVRPALLQQRMPRGREHILAVDDEETLTEILRKALEHLGYRVTTTTDPREARAWFGKDPDSFHLLITDMTMPKMTGDRLVADVLKVRSHFPIIICTGYSDQLSEARVREIGARALLMKPFDIGALALLVREVLDS